MSKSLLLAYETGEDNHISIRRCFDIKRNRLTEIDPMTSDFPELTSITLPSNIYNKTKDNDILAVEWEATNDPDTGITYSNITNINISEEVFEILDLELRGNEIETVVKNGFTTPFELRDKFFILTGLSNALNYIAVLFEKKYFTQDLEGHYMLKEQYNNRPIISFDKYLIPKADIVYIEPQYTNLNYRRSFYKYTDLEEISKYGTIQVDDGVKVLLNYYKNVLENRKSDLKITHREIQEFHTRLIGLLKENNDAIDYLMELGYPFETAEKAVDDAEAIIEKALLANDTNSELVISVILNSEDIKQKYYEEIVEKIKKENQELIDGYTEEVKTKKDEINQLNNSITQLKKEEQKYNAAVEEAKSKFEKASKEVECYDNGLEQKVTDYVLSNAYLSKLIGSTTVKEDKSISNPHMYVEGDEVSRTEATYSTIEEICTRNLGIMPSYKKDFTEFVVNTYNNNMSFIIDSYYSEDFADYLSMFIEGNKYSTLYIDNNAPLSTLKNVIENKEQVILVKNALKYIDIKYIDYLTSNFNLPLFIFEVSEPTNLKYMPKLLWKKCVYLYYGDKLGTVQRNRINDYYIMSSSGSEYNDEFLSIAAEAINIDLDDENAMDFNYSDINSLLDKLLVVNNSKKFNMLYAPTIVLFLQSLGVDISNFKISDKLLEKYISSITKE